MFFCSVILYSLAVVLWCRITVFALAEVAENRSGKFRFGRHVANAFLSVAKLQKKPMQKALAAYEDGTFNLP